MSDVNNNDMGPVIPASPEAKAVFHEVKEQVIEKLNELNHLDKVHGLHEVDGLKRIERYVLVEYAVEEVAYGYNYFGKIHISEDYYIHVRCHKYHDGRVDFYSIKTEGTALWPLEEPLTYFID